MIKNDGIYNLRSIMTKKITSSLTNKGDKQLGFQREEAESVINHLVSNEDHISIFNNKWNVNDKRNKWTITYLYNLEHFYFIFDIHSLIRCIIVVFYFFSILVRLEFVNLEPPVHLYHLNQAFKGKIFLFLKIMF